MRQLLQWHLDERQLLVECGYSTVYPVIVLSGNDAALKHTWRAHLQRPDVGRPYHLPVFMITRLMRVIKNDSFPYINDDSIIVCDGCKARTEHHEFLYELLP